MFIADCRALALAPPPLPVTRDSARGGQPLTAYTFALRRIRKVYISAFASHAQLTLRGQYLSLSRFRSLFPTRPTRYHIAQSGLSLCIVRTHAFLWERETGRDPGVGRPCHWHPFSRGGSEVVYSGTYRRSACLAARIPFQQNLIFKSCSAFAFRSASCQSQRMTPPMPSRASSG